MLKANKSELCKEFQIAGHFILTGEVRLKTFEVSFRNRFGTFSHDNYVKRFWKEKMMEPNEVHVRTVTKILNLENIKKFTRKFLQEFLSLKILAKCYTFFKSFPSFIGI